LHEKVVFIEDHQNEYVVMGLREVEDHGNEKDHVHSIVMNVNSRHGRFDLDNLITFLQGSQMEPLVEEFERISYLPWVDRLAKSNAKKLRAILLTMDRYASVNVEIPIDLYWGTTATSWRNTDLLSVPGSAGGRSGRRASVSGSARSAPKKRVAESSAVGKSSRKRRRSLPGAAAGISASTSALTNVSPGATTSTVPVPDFVKFALIQRNFWAEQKDCFFLDRGTESVHISQSTLAKDQYVIWTLQRDIVDSVKELI